MEDLIKNDVWTQVERPDKTLVVSTMMLYKRKIRADGKNEKYKSRLVAQGNLQSKGVHYEEASSPAPTAASTKMVRSTAAITDWEIRHENFEEAYLQAPTDQEISVEIPEEY